MFMACNMDDGVVLHDGCTQACQRFILTVFKEFAFNAFKLYSNRVIVAVVSAPVMGVARMPGTVVGADELPEITVAANIKMGRYFHALDGLEVRMLIPVKLVGEQLLYFIATKLSWWKTDGVQHDQINPRVGRTRSKIG